MFNKINEKLKAYQTRREESGSAIIFALILLIVTFSLVSTVTAFGLVNLQKALFVQAYTNNGLAAETAVSNALLVANSPEGTALLKSLSKVDGPTANNVIKGTVPEEYSSGNGGQKWVWYTERVNTSSAVDQYYIHAWGFQNTPTDPYARHLRVRVESVANMTASYTAATNQITYYPAADAVSQWGILGSSSFHANPGANLQSYVSDKTTDPDGASSGINKGQGKIASNGVIFMGSSDFFGANSRTDGRINLLNFSASDTVLSRCTGDCSESAYTINKPTYRTDLTSIATAVEKACPLQTYAVWKASEQGGVLDAGCYNSLIFDADTVVPTSATEDSPAMVYIKGDVKVSAGVKVNYKKSPLALRIYSQGGSLAEFTQGTVSNPTRVSAYLAGSVLKCTDLTDSNSVPQGMTLYFYGSMACDSVNVGGGTQIWWDELSADLAGDTSNVRRLWYTTSYEEIYGN